MTSFFVVFSEDLEKLKFLLKDEQVPVAQLERATSGFTIFEILEKPGILGPLNTDKLKEWLNTLQLKKALDELEIFMKSDRRLSKEMKFGNFIYLCHN